MARKADQKTDSVLDPIERVTEVIFGALMALTFTGSFSVASPGEEVRTMMWAALGCNLAWGLTDAVMYLIGLKVERQRRVTLLQQLQATQDPERARQFVRDALPERLGEAASPGVIDALQRTLLEAEESDGAKILADRLDHVQGAEQRRERVATRIANDKAAYLETWLAHDTGGRVSPARFFQALRRRLPDDGIVVADDGNHTFLVAELMPMHAPRTFFSPSDFNSMGYCVPGVIGAKLARPDRVVVGIVGDGAVRMTGLEMATAVAQGTGVVWFVFNDGELAQIAQAQQVPYNRKTCTVLPPLDLEALARANSVGFEAMSGDADIEGVLERVLSSAAAGRPVLVDVRIDYSKRTRFTEGTIRTNLKRFDLGTKARLVSRALWRRITG